MQGRSSLAVSRAGGDGLTRVAAPGPATVLVIGVLAAAAGAGVVYADWPFPRDARGFTGTGQYLLWVSLLLAQAALWAVLSVLIAGSLRVLWRFGEENWSRVIRAACAIEVAWILVGVASALARTSFDYKVPLPHVGAKLAVFTAAGGAVALAALLGMVLVWSGLLGLADKVGQRAATDASISDLLLLREHLQRLLTIEGAIIGAAVLSYAALRNAVLANSPKQPFPEELVLIYGGTFSIALAFVWAPIYGLMVAVGGRLCDSTIADRAAGESWTNWNARRTEAADAIGLQMSATASFRSALAILTPLGSALVGLLFDN